MSPLLVALSSACGRVKGFAVLRNSRSDLIDTNVLSEVLKPLPSEMVLRWLAAQDAAGLPISQFDAMIAAIAKSRRAAVATRNTADFERCRIQIINPGLNELAGRL
jgi:predicted nucleic acid-binding protein